MSEERWAAVDRYEALRAALRPAPLPSGIGALRERHGEYARRAA